MPRATATARAGGMNSETEMRRRVAKVFAVYGSLAAVAFGVLAAGVAGAWFFGGLALETSGWGGRTGAAGLALLFGGLGIQGLLFWLPLGRTRAEGRAATVEEEATLRDLLRELEGAGLGAPPSMLIRVGMAVDAFASFDGGLGGALRGRRSLCVGLPLLEGLGREGLKAILAHELAHFRDAWAMQACALAWEVEGGLSRLSSYGSQRLRRWHREKRRLTVASILGLAVCTVCEQLAGAMTAPLRPLGRRAFERLLEEMEYQADAVAASVAGRVALLEAMDAVARRPADGSGETAGGLLHARRRHLEQKSLS